jgi:hypothetical protein
MLAGELDIREGHLDTGLDSLRAAVSAQDQLAYDEPPGWLIPARHSLGAALLSAGRLAEAKNSIARTSPNCRTMDGHCTVFPRRCDRKGVARKPSMRTGNPTRLDEGEHQN